MSPVFGIPFVWSLLDALGLGFLSFELEDCGCCGPEETLACGGLFVVMLLCKDEILGEVVDFGFGLVGFSWVTFFLLEDVGGV